ncbi:hypothetical protein FRC01_008380 [Tulasnella sp. 417]|nr:hypothetical protein FRC01_008380 [Tulasnella sp. 417]
MATVNGTHPKSSAGATPAALPAGTAGVKKNVSAAGPAPSTAPPAPPTATRAPPRTNSTGASSVAVNGTTTSSKTKKKEAAPPDTATLFENVKNRIAVLEEDKRHLEEDERRAAEEARENIKGIHDSVIQSKYIELFQEMKRIEREFGKEKQKLVKEKDASKAQLTKANIAKTKLENLARELQKNCTFMWVFSVKERLKHVLRQYEVREKHFECVVRSKELEMLVTRARLEELRRLTEEEIRLLRQKLEEMQDSQNKLMDKVIACCQELLDADSGGTSQQLVMFLQEEMEKRGLKLPPDSGLDSPVNGHSGG